MWKCICVVAVASQDALRNATPLTLIFHFGVCLTACPYTDTLLVSQVCVCVCMCVSASVCACVCMCVCVCVCVCVAHTYTLLVTQVCVSYMCAYVRASVCVCVCGAIVYVSGESVCVCV